MNCPGQTGKRYGTSECREDRGVLCVTPLTGGFQRGSGVCHSWYTEEGL